MGVKKGTAIFSRDCAVEATLAGLHKMINVHIGSTNSSNKHVIAIDGMLWLSAAINNPSDGCSSSGVSTEALDITRAGLFAPPRHNGHS